MLKGDTFCGELAKVSCENCPLRLLREEQIVCDIRDGVTPFQAADALMGAVESVPAGYWTSVAAGENISQPGQSGDIDTIELLGEFVTTEVIDSLETNTLQPAFNREHVNTEIKFGPLYRGLKLCIQKKIAGQCTAEVTESQAAPPVMPIRVDNVFGADVLETFARDGTDADVESMVQRIGEVVKDNMAESDLLWPEPAEFGQAGSREFLFGVANVLRNRAKGSSQTNI